MTDYTPEQLAMARRIADRIVSVDDDSYSDFAMYVARDAALAAIIETTELAARWLDEQSDLGADHGLAAEKGTTKRAAYGGGSLALHRSAAALRNQEHLHACK